MYPLISADAISIYFKDNCGGISTGRENIVFKKRESSKGDGRGLGMYGARSVANSHGGILDFSNRIGEGVTFYFTFPIKRVNVEDKLCDVSVVTTL